MDKDNFLIKTFMFRAYPNKGASRRIYRAMKFAATPVWNACVAEREEARESYRKKVEDAIIDNVQELKRDLTEKEEKEIRKAIAKDHYWPTAYDQYKHVRKSEHPEYAPFAAKMLECVVAKVDGSEKSFRALWVKGDTKARPPRQTHLHRCLTWRCSGWKPKHPTSGRITLTGVGSLKFKLHRPIEGRIKTVSLRKENGRYYIGFSCEIEKSGVCSPVSKPKSPKDKGLRQEYTSTGGSDPNLGGIYNLSNVTPPERVGGSDPNLGGTYNVVDQSCCRPPGGSDLDLGREVAIGFGWRQNMFLIDSDGRAIEHPEFYTSNLGRLAYLNQKLSRRTKWECEDCRDINDKYRTVKRKKRCLSCGSDKVVMSRSENGWKAKRTLAKFHEHLANKRAYFLWNLVRFYVDRYDKIIVNKWPMKQAIEYAVENKTARKLCDGAYSKFIQMLKHKCNEQGKEFEERKDLLWQKEVDRLMDVAETESLRRMIRLTRTAILWPSQGHLISLKRESRRRAI